MKAPDAAAVPRSTADSRPGPAIPKAMKPAQADASETSQHMNCRVPLTGSPRTLAWPRFGVMKKVENFVIRIPSVAAAAAARAMGHEHAAMAVVIATPPADIIPRVIGTHSENQR